jgi:hypothetical protein
MPADEVAAPSRSDAMETPAARMRRPTAAITRAARSSLFARYACHASARASTCPAPEGRADRPGALPPSAGAHYSRLVHEAWEGYPSHHGPKPSCPRWWRRSGAAGSAERLAHRSSRSGGPNSPAAIHS